MAHITKLLIFLIVFVGIITSNVLGHSGGTDWRGGHHDRKHGGYHFHHGYPPHDHINGKCPYDEGYSLTNNSTVIQHEKSTGKTIRDNFGTITISAMAGIFIIVVFSRIFNSRKNNRHRR